MNPFRSLGTPGSGASNESIRHLLSRAVERGAAPGLIAAIVDRRGVRAIAAAGVRKVGHAQPLPITDLVHIGSNTKAMTAAMLAVLVRDGVFGSGWNTSIAEVFPELRDDIHPHYRAVTLWRLVTMTGGIRCDAANWHAHGDAHLMERRYRILRDNLADPPGAAAGKYLYSNLAYVVAGAMAERVTARTWESLMQERLFMPLGISSAGFGAPGTLEEPSAGEREGSTPRKEEPSAGEREGSTPRKEEPSAGEREGLAPR
ncbi:MAG: serine hydrolase, partial [Gammaproteobacteria bacterium]|nr:serine hydrolase [Gammaproteobacteria bacterium]